MVAAAKTSADPPISNPHTLVSWINCEAHPAWSAQQVLRRSAQQMLRRAELN